MNDFIAQVASAAGTTPTKAEAVLRDLQVETMPVPSSRASLRLTAIQFTGEKTVTGEPPAAVDFAWCFEGGLTAITSARNLRGKSTVLWLVRWGLTGERPKQITDDVHAWLTGARLQAEVDGTPFDVEWTIEDGTVTGHLKVGKQQPTPFESHIQFQGLMERFLLDRLHLRAYPSWKSLAGGTDAGGTVSEHGWTSQFHALLVRGDKVNVTLGEHTADGQAQMLLHVFLGLPWAYTAKAANAAEKAEKYKLDAARRRTREDAAARDTKVEPARTRLGEIERELADSSKRGSAFDPAETDRRTSAFSQGSRAVAQADIRRQAQVQDVELLQRHANEASKRLTAAVEDQVILPLIGRVKPASCPRCTTPISEERVAQETQHQACSVCDSALPESEERHGDPEEASANAARAQDDLREAEHELASRDKALTVAKSNLEAARAALAEIHAAAPQYAAVRELELERATLLGRIDGASRAPADEEDEDPVAWRVAQAAQAASNRLRKEASGTLLDQLGEEIVSIARSFGIDGIEAATPDLGAHLALVINGEASSFSKRTAGERLRLKLALIVGLLRVADAHGVGRHPGLLLIDSPAEQEMVGDDFQKVLEELQRICDETPDLQIVMATANHDDVKAAVHENRIIHGEDWGGRLVTLAARLARVGITDPPPSIAELGGPARFVAAMPDLEEEFVHLASEALWDSWSDVENKPEALQALMGRATDVAGDIEVAEISEAAVHAALSAGRQCVSVVADVLLSWLEEPLVEERPLRAGFAVRQAALLASDPATPTRARLLTLLSNIEDVPESAAVSFVRACGTLAEAGTDPWLVDKIESLGSREAAASQAAIERGYAYLRQGFGAEDEHEALQAISSAGALFESAAIADEERSDAVALHAAAEGILAFSRGEAAQMGRWLDIGVEAERDLAHGTWGTRAQRSHLAAGAWIVLLSDLQALRQHLDSTQVLYVGDAIRALARAYGGVRLVTVEDARFGLDAIVNPQVLNVLHERPYLREAAGELAAEHDDPDLSHKAQRILREAGEAPKGPAPRRRRHLRLLPQSMGCPFPQTQNATS